VSKLKPQRIFTITSIYPGGFFTRFVPLEAEMNTLSINRSYLISKQINGKI